MVFSNILVKGRFGEIGKKEAAVAGVTAQQETGGNQDLLRGDDCLLPLRHFLRLFHPRIDVGDYSRNDADYQLPRRLGQLIRPGKMKPHAGVTKFGLSAIVHVLEMASQLPQICPFYAEVIRQPIQRKQGRLVFSFDDIVNRAG